MAAGGGQAIPAFDNLAKGVNYEVDAALHGIQNGKFPTMGPTPRVMLNAMKLSSGMHIPQGPINTMLESPSATLGIDDSPLVKAFTPTQVMSQQQAQQPQMQAQPTAVMTPQTDTSSANSPAPYASMPISQGPGAQQPNGFNYTAAGGQATAGTPYSAVPLTTNPKSNSTNGNTSGGIGNQGIV